MKIWQRVVDYLGEVEKKLYKLQGFIEAGKVELSDDSLTIPKSKLDSMQGKVDNFKQKFNKLIKLVNVEFNKDFNSMDGLEWNPDSKEFE